MGCKTEFRLGKLRFKQARIMKIEFFSEALQKAKSLSDIFELVKEGVRQTIGTERAGLMLGLSDLGITKYGFIGAFYPIGTNIIIMNKTPLKNLIENNNELFNPYAFHVLLHEYLHSLGIIDEKLTERYTYMISKKLFGSSHIVTSIAKDFSKFFNNIVYPSSGWLPEENLEIEIVQDFDKSNVTYIM